MNIDPPSHSPELLHVDRALLPGPRHDLLGADAGAHPPRILLLYGSLRPQSYSRKLALEAERILRLAVMQVCGGSQSFNVVNQLRVLGRWMRMFTIPNQSSVPKAYLEFDEDGRMKPSAYYDRVVDVMEELVKAARRAAAGAGVVEDAAAAST